MGERNIVKKIILYTIGCMIIGLGNVCYIQAGLGSTSFTILSQGISMNTPLSVGESNQVLFAAIVLVLLFADRKMLRIGMLLNIILVGEFMDLFLQMDIMRSDLLIVRFVVLGLGVLLYPAGVTITIAADLGPGPVDSLMQLLKKKTGADVALVRILMDSAMVVAGAIMGAVVGVGTLAGAFLTGVLLKKFLKFVR